jgi:hypothetical protein
LGDRPTVESYLSEIAKATLADDSAVKSVSIAVLVCARFTLKPANFASTSIATAACTSISKESHVEKPAATLVLAARRIA